MQEIPSAEEWHVEPLSLLQKAQKTYKARFKPASPVDRLQSQTIFMFVFKQPQLHCNITAREREAKESTPPPRESLKVYGFTSSAHTTTAAFSSNHWQSEFQMHDQEASSALSALLHLGTRSSRIHALRWLSCRVCLDVTFGSLKLGTPPENSPGMWPTRIQYLLAFSCLYTSGRCQASHQCAPYTDLAGKIGVNCSHRSLESVPTTLPTDTEVLLLGFNSIDSVSLSSFKYLSKLHDLDLSHNRIKHLEADSPLLVEKMDLSSNTLTTLPDFSKLTNLRKLIMDHNQIDVLPKGVFDPLGKLEDFSIRGNAVSDIPSHIFDPLEKLRYLTLSANKIQEFPSGSLDRMESLETLDISSNKLRTIPQDLFENNLLQYTFLYNNPWDCECSSGKYLKEWVDDNDGNIYKVLGAPDSESVVCETPVMWRGIPMINITLKQMCPITTTETMVWVSTVREITTTLSSPVMQTSTPMEVCTPYTDLAGKVGVNCSHRSLESVPTTLPTDTEVLLLGFNSIDSVSLSSFKYLSKLHDLDLSHNQIKHLEADSPLLVEKVDLSSNALTTLPDFSKLTNLRKLIMDHNQIDVLPKGVFDPLGKLEGFSIRGNAVSDIPSHIFDPLEKLRYLTLSANKIQEFPSGSLDRMESLETLDISSNKLRTIPQDLFENNRLHYVLLYNNPWDCECSSGKYLKEWVDDNDGNIYKVLGAPDSESVVCEMPAIWRGTPMINITLKQMCPITTTETMVWVSTVREISTTLSSPVMQTSTPMEVCTLYTDLAGKVGVNCSHRFLVSVPNSLPTDTEVLLLGFNSIESVSLSSFKNLSKLHDLDLSHNRIKHLEADSPLLVEKVDLSSNALTSLPDFSKLTNLRKLIMDHNQIDVLQEGVFNPLRKLESFSIRGNAVSDIPDHIFDPLEELRHLTLSANKIQEFPSGLLDNLVKLVALDISSNSLCTVPPDFFRNNSLFLVSLYNNPWCCDCDIQYLFEWIRDHGDTVLSSDGSFDDSAAYCRAPPELRGVPLIQVSIQNRCIGTSPPSTSVPATSPPSTSVPATSPPSTSVPATSPPSTSVPATSPPSTSVPATSPPSTSVPATSPPSTSVPTTMPLSLSPTSRVTYPDFSALARRSSLFGLLRRLGCSCCLLFLLYFFSLLFGLLQVSALVICFLRFRQRLYLPLKHLSQRHPHVSLVRYSLVLPNYQQIYPLLKSDTSEASIGETQLEGDRISDVPIEQEADTLSSFL
ncbi:slit homolog 2 protein-like [Narcine bancroftii]|uniref:slit homolog 2 protein-like n=1 Tax=Narcine bancroftii TaxID=1343680 RepID=UPI003831E401